MSLVTAILWCRNDLRLSDNPALCEAIKHDAVVPVYIWNPDEYGAWPPGAALKWWIHQNLVAFNASLQELGSRLIIRSGSAQDVLEELCEETKATTVLMSYAIEPSIQSLQHDIFERLTNKKIAVKRFNSSLLYSPQSIKNKSGSHYNVYTPFSKAILAKGLQVKPLPVPKALPSPKVWPKSLGIGDLNLLPNIAWDRAFFDHWHAGESSAHKAIKHFLKEHVDSYETGRNIPADDSTSKLSLYFNLGIISPRQVWHALSQLPSPKKKDESRQVFIKEVIWREFAYHLLAHFPEMPERSLRRDFEDFPWQESPENFNAWTSGHTGFPIVDAGMRQLWKIGWMHNRVRMIVASFLVKDLLIPWQEGAKWFWDTLVDADLAANSQNWQWCAGTGVDPSPFFRIFNPTLQSQKFDPEGLYIKEWVPELRKLDAKWIHCPWEAPDEILERAGVKMGASYPVPIVDHSEARDTALALYKNRTLPR